MSSDYLIQRGGVWHYRKTAILLLAFAHVGRKLEDDRARQIGNHEVEKGRVLYFAGEIRTTSACAGSRWRSNSDSTSMRSTSTSSPASSGYRRC